MAQGVVYQNAIGKIISVNSAAERLLGLTAEQLEGRTSIDPQWRAIHEDGSDFPGEQHPALIALKTGKPVNNMVMGVYHPDKKEHVWILVNSEPEFRHGESKPFQVFTTFTDITALRKAEEELRKFRTISDRANYGNAIAALDGTLLYVNDCYAKMHGYEPNEIIGKNLALLYSGEEFIKVKDILDKLINQENYQTEEVWRTRKDGSIFPSLMNALVIKDKDGKPLFMSATTIDISEIKKSEEALRKNEESLNYAQEIAKMGSWTLDLTNNRQTWSKNLFKLMGLENLAEALPYDEYLKMIHPDDIHRLEEKYQEMIKIKDPISYDYRFVLPDGSVKWFQNNVAPVYEGDKLVSLRGTNIDITEKKLKDKEIKKLSLAVEQSPVMVLISDLEGNIEYANSALEETTGYTREELLNKNPRILKSDKQDSSFYKLLWDTILAGKVWHGELINKKKNGTLYWEEMTITPIQDEMGKTTNYLAVKQDISERKKTEQEIRELNTNLEQKIEARTAELRVANEELQQEIEERTRIEDALIIKTNELENFFSVALDLLCILDIKGNFIKVNKAWENILGYSTAELERKKFWEFVHPDDVNASDNAIKILMQQKIVFDFVNRYRTINGSYRYIEWRCVLVDNYIYAAARDITERIKTEIQLKQAQEDAEKANAAKSEFLSRMSHELRTPMNSILGFTQLLSMDELNTEQTNYVNQIMRSGKHLLDLINEVLDISRIESGRLLISIEPVKIIDIIQEVIDIQQPLANQNNIHIELNPSPNYEQYVKTDKQRLKQVIFNLINNAIKYNTKGGSIKIDTSLKNNDEKVTTAVRIAVSDTGIGIAESDIPNLFIPFERIGADKTHIEGTGLGLAVVKKLLEAMGGIIGVESKPGVGSTFWIELPLADIQHILYEVHSPEILKTSANLANIKASILYIEDNAPNIELVNQILRLHCPNITLQTCMNGKDAISLISENKPDLILLDLNLPDIHGSEVLQVIMSKETTKTIPVVIVSADAMTQQSEKLIHLGARKYLTKPIDVIAFLQALNDILK